MDGRSVSLRLHFFISRRNAPRVSHSLPHLMSSDNPSPRPAVPSDEARRVDALRRYDILDTPPEEEFDRVTRLAARWLDVPIALITFLDSDRQWFKSCIGVDERETSREVAFCAHNIHDESILVVEDATTDPRFADNPLVTGEPGIRFYAGAPLVTPEGHILGSLCVIDTSPRTADSMALGVLQDLSRIVVNELELRAANMTLRERNEQVRSMSQELKRAQETGRARLSELLHEELKQVLQAARMTIENLDDSDMEGNGRLQHVRNDISDALDITSTLSARFAPPVGNQPLHDTLAWLAAEMQEAHGLSVSILGSGGGVSGDRALKTLLYRAVREILYCVVQRTDTSAAQVGLVETAGHVRVTVEDDGEGFDPAEGLEDCRPLARIRTQLEALGGHLRSHSRPGVGTCVTIDVPQRSPSASPSYSPSSTENQTTTA